MVLIRQINNLVTSGRAQQGQIGLGLALGQQEILLADQG